VKQEDINRYNELWKKMFVPGAIVRYIDVYTNKENTGVFIAPDARDITDAMVRVEGKLVIVPSSWLTRIA